MPSFNFTARSSAGALESGTLIADSVNHATQLLRAGGKYPTAIHATDQSSAPNKVIAAAGVKITRADVIQFSTQLSIMVETGVGLIEALDCISSQSEKPAVQKLVADLSQEIQGGSDLSSALSRHPRSFPRLYIALIRASEKSGMLGKLLNRATDYLRDEQEILRRVRGALTYPSIMLAFAVSTTIFLLAFVLPKFTAIYSSKAAALPMPTKVLMALSDFLVHRWIWLLVGAAVIGIGGYLYRRTAPGERFFAYLQLHFPLMGAMFRKLHLSRGLRMIGTMAGAGVSLMDAVQTAQDLCSNIYYRELWITVSGQIEAGKQLSEPLFQSPLVPRAVAQMILSAEKSGKLGPVMEQVAGYAERELKEKIADLTRYIEPIMIVIMGLIIGTVALALLLPIFTISRVMSQPG